MAEDKSLTNSSNNLTASPQAPGLTRAKSFKVTSVSQNYAQYVKTVKAYALAGLPFEHIANAGETLGDLVERGEIDAPLSSLNEKIGEIAEDESKMMAWQSRGETISLTHQLSGGSTNGREVVIVTQQVTTTQTNNEKTIDVIEGIGVFNQYPPQVQTASQPPSSQLENNPYLKAPADIKKF